MPGVAGEARLSEASSWAFPTELQPDPDEVAFDLARALDSVVALRAEVPDDAFTAGVLGTERFGSGVVIRPEGLILTIGYLVTEASSVWITTNAGAAVEGHPLAYDQATGFGLVLPLGPLVAPALPLGDPAGVEVGSDVYVVGHGGRAHALTARLMERREFAGYWEYVLDEALFTVPAHPQWGGTALLDDAGRLVGIGSLLLEETLDGEDVQANMFVPVDLLQPILDHLVRHGRAPGRPRPWLGMYTAELGARLVVNGIAEGGPADAAGMLPGDVVIEVNDARPASLADFYRRVWALGPAGTTVPLVVSRRGKLLRVEVQSADRSDFLWRPSLQ
jgi:S1-C subfamily serine protease